MGMSPAVKRISMLVAALSLLAPAVALGDALPPRETPIPPTTKGIPHKQFLGEAVPQVHAELMRRVALLPERLTSVLTMLDCPLASTE